MSLEKLLLEQAAILVCALFGQITIEATILHFDEKQCLVKYLYFVIIKNMLHFFFAMWAGHELIQHLRDLRKLLQKPRLSPHDILIITPL